MSLDSLVAEANQNDLKFIFVGGKGGVGKTTTSSAIATLLATTTSTTSTTNSSTSTQSSSSDLTLTTHKKVLLVSTDPAHSLGDAWRTKFGNVPSSPIPNLDVMEINPKETMDKELEQWVQFAKSFESDSNNGDNEKNGDEEMMNKVLSFQEWLSGIPGIDEATALSHAISYIESGNYDLIVFDTAPTGHTLKLLALPEILKHGIDKLQSWQSTLWGYWEAFKGLTSSGGTSQKLQMKEQISQKLQDYKTNIEKVASMLQDPLATRFVVVCIAEFLSVSETQRLLQELTKHKVKASHIVVNQLVTKDALTQTELQQLESLAEVGDGLNMNPTLLQKTIHACRLTTARRDIQEKYLKMLQGFEETQGILKGICQVPLLADEVTGTDAITRFSELLVTADTSSSSSSSSTATTNSTTGGTKRVNSKTPKKGDVVRIMGLMKAPHLNGLEGTIVSDADSETGRYGVSVMYQSKPKRFALQLKNISFVNTDFLGGNLSPSSSRSSKIQKTSPPSPATPSSSSSSTTTNTTNTSRGSNDLLSDSTISKAKKVLEDPEIKQMIVENPKLKDAVEDVMANPMNFMKYISDPEISPFLSKAMSKLQGI